MSNTDNKPSLAQSVESTALRLLGKLGGLGVMKNDRVRNVVERTLYNTSKAGFAAQTKVGRAFTKKPSGGDATRVAPTKPHREFNLTPTEDQQMILEVASDIADDVIRPAAAKADETREVPETVSKAIAEMGLTLLGVPAELGGVAEERSAVTGALVIEQLARGDMGLAVAVMAPAAVANAIANYGNATQQSTYIPAFADEENPAIAALGIYERAPLFDPRQPATTAEAQGEEYVLNGEKALVPLADKAELFVVTASLDGAARMFIVEAGTAGLKSAPDPAMGVRAARTGRLVLEDVRVPAGNLLGDADDTLDAIRRARVAWCAAAAGTGRAVLDHLTGYVQERKAFGEPIGHRQAVAFTVADIAIEIDALRLVTLRAAARLDAGDDASPQIARARALASTYGSRIGSDAVQMLGGHGFVKEFDNERWYRDLRAAGVLEGTLLV